MKSNRLFWLPFSICAGPLFIWLFLVPKLLWSFEPFDTSESGYIDPPIPNTVVIAVNLGNIRESPSQSSPIKYKLQKGDSVSVVETRDEWYHVKFPKDKSGWAHESLFVDTVPASTPYVAQAQNIEPTHKLYFSL